MGLVLWMIGSMVVFAAAFWLVIVAEDHLDDER